MYCTALGVCIEISLQVEYAKAITGPLPLTIYYNDNYSLMNYFQWLLDTEGVPLVHVLSLIHDDSSQLSYEYMTYVNYHFMIAAARGFSLFYASGDDGVWGASGVIGADYNPAFPASAPWVTSIGGSNVIADSNTNIQVGVAAAGGVRESVWECSGGGFSDYFPMPGYQQSTVLGFIHDATQSASIPPTRLYNSTGRGYPDLVAVAGEANPYCVVIRGGQDTIGISTTTASATVLASVFSLINNQRLANGKTALGFINPLLYASSSDSAGAVNIQQCYRDIRDGSMNQCHLGTQGFQTIPGWDAASGFGSVDVGCLIKLLA